MSNPQKENIFNCLLFEPVADNRVRLKQATSFVHYFGSTVTAKNQGEALKILNKDDPIGIVFVTGCLPQDELAPFISQAKQTKQGDIAAFILVRRSQVDNGIQVADSMMAGLDGLLCEPYSVDQLDKITKLATKIRKDRLETRERITIALIIRDLISQLDVVAFLKACECEPALSMRKLRGLSERIHSISPEYHDLYFNQIVAAFEQLPPPKNYLQSKLYSGASSRVKQALERKLMSRIEADKAKEESK